MSVSKKAQKLSLLYQNKSEDIAQNITVDPSLESLIPPLSEEEYSNLEESIKQEGCREPLIIWKNNNENILVDGHNRYRICKANNIRFDFTVKKFSDKIEVKNWMLGNQMSRRNLSPFQMSYLRGLRYETEKQGHGGLRATGQNDQLSSDTSKKLAEEYAVGEKTIRRDAKFTQGLNRFSGEDQKIRWAILSGKIQAKKQTISDLADQDDEFLNQLRAKLEETANLEQALKLLSVIDGDPGAVKEVSESQAVYKNLISKLKKAGKLDKNDHNKKEMIKEIKALFGEYLRLIS